MNKRNGQLALALLRARELEIQLERTERELERERRQRRSLMVAFNELSAGPIHQVSEDQFSMLVAEGPLNG